MAEESPLFPNAKSMHIHSGNIVNWTRLKRKPNQTSTEEVCECIGKTLAAYLESTSKTDLQHVSHLYKVNSENVQKLDENEREEVKITVKVFICASQPPSVISEVVDKVLGELGTNFIESLLLAVAPTSVDDDEDDSASPISLSTIQPYWEAMEKLVSADKVLSIGICDLTKDALEDLYNWAKVKPCIDQVNLESCCVMPQDLTEYAKSINVQLLTHNDRPEFISVDKLQETIQNVSTKPDSLDWKPQWVVRYSGILKCRGIIQMKGYIFYALRESSKDSL
uniref:GCS light chain n=1 Tax=Arion vulgaris TaxID=1028688 RepID=A0A0B6ZLB9_9EUPU